jgi:hypothetical protein
MAYTLSSLITNIQRRVDSATTADADVVANKCGQVIDEIVAQFAPQHPSFLRVTDTFATVASQRGYAASALSGGDTIDGSRGILRIIPPQGYDRSGKGELLQRSQEWILDRYPDTTQTGTPIYWAPVGSTEAGVESWWLAPTPDAALTFTMVFYKRATIPEDSGDSIGLPQDVIRVVEQGATAYFKDERGDVDADKSLELYATGLGQILARYYPDEYEDTVQVDPVASANDYDRPRNYGIWSV